MLIEITGVTSGNSPYDIYLCTWDLSSCFFISGSTTIPPTVTINTDNYFPNNELLQIKIVDMKKKQRSQPSSGTPSVDIGMVNF